MTTKCWLQRKKICHRFPSPIRCNIFSSTENLTEWCSWSEKCFTTIWCTDECFTCSSFIFCSKIVIYQFSTIYAIIFLIRDSRTESSRKVCRRCLIDGLRVRSGIPALSRMIFERLQWPIINFEKLSKIFSANEIASDCGWQWCWWLNVRDNFQMLSTKKFIGDLYPYFTLTQILLWS